MENMMEAPRVGGAFIKASSVSPPLMWSSKGSR